MDQDQCGGTAQNQHPATPQSQASNDCRQEKFRLPLQAGYLDAAPFVGDQTYPFHPPPHQPPVTPVYAINDGRVVHYIYGCPNLNAASVYQTQPFPSQQPVDPIHVTNFAQAWAYTYPFSQTSYRPLTDSQAYFPWPHHPPPGIPVHGITVGDTVHYAYLPFPGAYQPLPVTPSATDVELTGGYIWADALNTAASTGRQNPFPSPLMPVAPCVTQTGYPAFALGPAPTPAYLAHHHFSSYIQGKYSLPHDPVVACRAAPSQSGYVSSSQNGYVSSRKKIKKFNAVLEDFKKDPERYSGLEDILGHISDFSIDSSGREFVMDQLRSASEEEKDLVFKEITPTTKHFDLLAKNIYGSEVVRSLLQFGKGRYATDMLTLLDQKLGPLSMSFNGYKVVQTLIEVSSNDDQARIITLLKPHAFALMRDFKGHQVMKTLIAHIYPNLCSFMLKSTIINDVLQLCIHPIASSVIKHCLEHFPIQYSRPLWDHVHCHFMQLAKDPVGAFVIRHALQKGDHMNKNITLSLIRRNVVRLASHKLGSFVFQTALDFADPDDREVLIAEILEAVQDQYVYLMAVDPHAKYILKKALDLSQGQQRDILLERLGSIVEVLDNLRV